MSSRGQRLNKSQSMMFSLYTLSGLAFLVLGAFLVLAVFESLQLLSFSVFLNTLETFYKSVGLTFLPMLISLPFVLSITFLVVSQSTSKFSIPVKSFMSWVEQAPRLLFGLIFLIFIGAGPMGYILSATAIVTAQLSRRWVHLALKVDQAQIDTIKSLGGDVWQILYFLFFKKSVFKFATHFFAVYFQIFVLVTPFLVFT